MTEILAREEPKAAVLPKDPEPVIQLTKKQLRELVHAANSSRGIYVLRWMTDEQYQFVASALAGSHQP